MNKGSVYRRAYVLDTERVNPFSTLAPGGKGMMSYIKPGCAYTEVSPKPDD